LEVVLLVLLSLKFCVVSLPSSCSTLVELALLSEVKESVGLLPSACCAEDS